MTEERPKSRTPEYWVWYRKKQKAEDPEKYLAKNKEYQDRWKENNPEAYRKANRKSARKYRDENREAYREYQREYHRKYRAKQKAIKEAKDDNRTED